MNNSTVKAYYVECIHDMYFNESIVHPIPSEKMRLTGRIKLVNNMMYIEIERKISRLFRSDIRKTFWAHESRIIFEQVSYIECKI